MHFTFPVFSLVTKQLLSKIEPEKLENMDNFGGLSSDPNCLKESMYYFTGMLSVLEALQYMYGTNSLIKITWQV